MITFKQFLSEGDEPINIGNLINDECHQYIDESAGLFAVRGMNISTTPTHTFTIPTAPNTPVPVHLIRVRKDRNSLHTPKVFHQMIDEWMKGKFGFSARSGGVFALGASESKVNLISYYGEPHIIIPHGTFSFIWSTKVGDLYEALDEEFGSIFTSGDVSQLTSDVLNNFLDGLGYTNEDLPSALKSGHEIMFDCQEYYAIPYSDSVLGYLKEILK